MKEMLLVGRGGEGVVVASQIMAETLARAGFWVQSFPEFTAERRGAPIAAYLRWSTAPIHRRHKMRDCDVLVNISPSPPGPETLARVRPGGLVVLNARSRFPAAAPFAVARVPASQIAREHAVLSAEGRPMGNVAVLGACVRLLLPGGITFLEQAIASRLGDSRTGVNCIAAREGFARCTRQQRRAGDIPLPPPPEVAPSRRPRFAVTTRDSRANQTGSWSLDRPVLSAACTACALCALFCPEAAITRSDGSIVIDYLHCKGCGICQTVCPVRDAIFMEEAPA